MQTLAAKDTCTHLQWCDVGLKYSGDYHGGEIKIFQLPSIERNTSCTYNHLEAMFHDTNPPPTEVPPGESWKSTTDLHSPGKTEHVWGEHLQLLWGRQLAEEDLTGSFSCKYVTEFEIQCDAVYLLDRSVTDF